MGLQYNQAVLISVIFYDHSCTPRYGYISFDLVLIYNCHNIIICVYDNKINYLMVLLLKRLRYQLELNHLYYQI